MKNITNLIHYIAGYIDGDGCFYVGTTTQKPKMITVFEASIQVVSTDEKPLKIFCENFGGSVRQRPARDRHKAVSVWTIKGEHAAKFAQDILPFLVDKAEQCRLFINYCQLIKRNNFKTVEQEVLTKRNSHIDKIRNNKNESAPITIEVINQIRQSITTIVPSDSDYGYFAGLIDSEGCFRIKKWKPATKPNYVYHICLEIGNTRYLMIDWLVRRFGGSITFKAAKNNRRSFAIWTLAAAALYKILPHIKPFLINKQQLCDKIIEFQQTVLPNGGDRHSVDFKANFKRIQEARERIIVEVHSINHKGSF